MSVLLSDVSVISIFRTGIFLFILDLEFEIFLNSLVDFLSKRSEFIYLACTGNFATKSILVDIDLTASFGVSALYCFSGDLLAQENMLYILFLSYLARGEIDEKKLGLFYSQLSGFGANSGVLVSDELLNVGGRFFKFVN